MFWTAVHARNPELRYFRRTGENHRVDGRSATSANRNLVDRARKAVFDGDPIADGQVLAVPLNAGEDLTSDSRSIWSHSIRSCKPLQVLAIRN